MTAPADARIRFSPAGLTFQARQDEDLLTAAAASGIAVPAACRNGVCEICEARLLCGQVLNTRNQQKVSEGAQILLCRSQPLADLELEMTAVMAAGTNSPCKYLANVTDVRSLNHDVYRVQLELPRRRELSFHAGQYLSVVLPNTEPCYFSIASAPEEKAIELHIQASPDWVSAQKVIEALTSGQQVTLEMPHGKACLASAPDEPVLMVAAGTGFAQMKSLIDYLRATRFSQPVTLFWGVRRLEDMYLRSLAESWQQDWPGFRFYPVVGDDEDNDWPGHHDQLVETVLASGADWSTVRVMASGSPAMVYTLMDALVAAGLPPSSFYSDVLEYAPRDA